VGNSECNEVEWRVFQAAVGMWKITKRITPFLILIFHISIRRGSFHSVGLRHDGLSPSVELCALIASLYSALRFAS